jgi:hypothetical protein
MSFARTRSGYTMSFSISLAGDAFRLCYVGELHYSETPPPSFCQESLVMPTDYVLPIIRLLPLHVLPIANILCNAPGDQFQSKTALDDIVGEHTSFCRGFCYKENNYRQLLVTKLFTE